MNRVIPSANRPPKPSASEALNEDALEELVDLAAPDVVLLELDEVLLDEEPLLTALPGRLTLALAASAL